MHDCARQTESFTLETHDANLEEVLKGAPVRKYSQGGWVLGVVSGFTPRLPDPQHMQRASAKADALEATASASAAVVAAAAAPASSPMIAASNQPPPRAGRKRKPSQKKVEADENKAPRIEGVPPRATAAAAVEAVPPAAAAGLAATASAPRQNGSWTVRWGDSETLVGAFELQAELCQAKSRQLLMRTREYYDVMHARARS